MNDASPAPNTSATADLYTALPYPGDGVVRRGIGLALQRALKTHASHLTQRPLRILDIGCGTGETLAGIAQTFPTAEVVGIDVNPRSLELAQRLAGERNLSIRFARLDVEDFVQGQSAPPDVLEGKFDVVTSIGVMHHFREPSRGLAFANQLIRPRGRFMCFMYSALGRREDIVVKNLVSSALGEGASFQKRGAAVAALSLSDRHTLTGGLRTLRRRLRVGPHISLSELARVWLKRDLDTHRGDTFSNPCEHLYHFGELRELFRQGGWLLDGLVPGCGLPTSVESHTRNEDTRALLRELPEDVLYDFFAYSYAAAGFTCLLQPMG